MTAIRDALADARRRYASRMASASNRDDAYEAKIAYEREAGAVAAGAFRDGVPPGLPAALEDELTRVRAEYVARLAASGDRLGESAFDDYVRAMARVVVQHGEARPAPRPVADVEPAEWPRITIEVVDTRITEDHPAPSPVPALASPPAPAAAPAPAPVPAPVEAADDGDIYDTYDRRLTDAWRQPPPTPPKRNGVQHDPVA